MHVYVGHMSGELVGAMSPNRKRRSTQSSDRGTTTKEDREVQYIQGFTDAQHIICSIAQASA